MTNGHQGFAGVNSGTMNNPKNSSGVVAFQRDNSQGHRRQSSSQFKNNQALNQFGRPINGFTAQMSPLNNYPNVHNQQSPTNLSIGQQLPQVFSNQNLNHVMNIVQSPPMMTKYTNGLASSMGVNQPGSSNQVGSLKYNSSKKVQVIPAHLVNMNATMAPSVNLLEDSQQLLSDNQSSGPDKKPKSKLTMSSIDNSLQGFQHYQRNLIQSPQANLVGGKISKFDLAAQDKTDTRQGFNQYQSPIQKSEKKGLARYQGIVNSPKNATSKLSQLNCDPIIQTNSNQQKGSSKELKTDIQALTDVKPRRKLLPLKAQTQMDLVNQSNDNYKKKTEDISTMINFGQKKIQINGQHKMLNNTITRIKEEDDADIRVNSSGDSDKRAEDTSDDSDSDPNVKDQYGASKQLRHQIVKKYQIIEVLGKGSYGCVSKAKCLRTGRIVALKIMENQTNTEYDTIKLLREIQLMRTLQQLCGRLTKQEIGTETCNLFTPELIDIICPMNDQIKKDLQIKRVTPEQSTQDTQKLLIKNKKKTKSNLNVFSASSYQLPSKQELDGINFSHLKSICIVMEFVDTDLDQILKHKIDFTEHHLLKVVYSSLCAISFLHQANVMHRDLKSANILIQSDCNAKICDFGLSRSLPQSCTDENSVNSMKLRYQMSQKMLAQNINRYKLSVEGEVQKQEYVSQYLNSDRSRRKKMKRYMSIHVGSRWYRAPEVSLVEKQYDYSADMWSFGCIIFELLQYVHKNSDTFFKDFQQKRYLFQGGSCFPLSPCKNKNTNNDGGKQKKVNMIGNTDQVKVILRSIGEQNENDLSFLTSSHAIQYVRELESSKIQTKDSTDEEAAKIKYAPLQEKIKPLKYGISRVNYEVIEIMKSLLKFNPYFRMTALECIQSKVFDPVRDTNKEKILNVMQQENTNLFSQTPTTQGFKSADTKFQATSPNSPQKIATTFEGISNGVVGQMLNNKVIIELPIDSSDAFDYENPDNAKYSVNDLKYILHKELIEIQQSISRFDRSTKNQ